MLPAERGEGGHPGGRSQAAGTCSRPWPPPAARPPGSRSECTCAGQTQWRQCPGTREEMEGEALFRGRKQCGLSFAPRGESEEGEALRAREETGSITS